MIEKLINKKYYFYSLLVSFLVLMFTSKCSFLYAFNDWVDANAFFTMGKSMMNGIIPYKDLFEQKGLILYFIYGIGYLLCHKAFLGVFILEVFSFSIFLYYAHKLFSMYLDKKYSIILLPILSYLITTSNAFVHGGSCEEFALPFLMITLYYYFKHFKVEKISNKEVMICGLFAGIVSMMKYTMIGLFAGCSLFIFIDYLKSKEIKNAFKYCLYFLIGMFIPIILCFTYLYLNHAVKEYIDCYFVFNMTLYKSEAISIFDSIIQIFSGFFGSLIKDGNILTILYLCILPLVFFIKDKKNSIYFKISLILIPIVNIITLYWGLRFLTYYILILYIYLIIVLLGLAVIYDKYAHKIISKYVKGKYSLIFFIIIPIIFIYLSYNNANYKDMLKMTKKDFFQFKYADYINKYKNPTLLNMAFLDGGLYTTTGIIPNVRFFEVQNIDYSKFPDNWDVMREAVINKKVKFVLYYSKLDYNYIENVDSYILDNYELVYDDVFYFEHRNMMHAYLFKLKELK